MENDRGDFLIFKMECDELLSQDPPANGESELDAADRVFEKFVADVELRAVGGRAHLNPRQRLRSEPEPYEKRGSHNVDDLLTKNAGARKRFAVKSWLSERLAFGDSLDDLVKHAEKFDLQAALLLRELGDELAA